MKRCYRTCAKERKEKKKREKVNVGEGGGAGSERREWLTCLPKVKCKACYEEKSLGKKDEAS